MIPALGGGLWPSIMHITTDEYHGYYPELSTQATSISILDSFILREGLHQLIERGLRKTSKTDGLWITKDEIKEFFTQINYERFGKKAVYEMERAVDEKEHKLDALDVWRGDFISQGGDRVKSQMSFKSRLKIFSDKIDFLRGKILKDGDPLAFLSYVKEFHSKKGSDIYGECAEKAGAFIDKLYQHMNLYKGKTSPSLRITKDLAIHYSKIVAEPDTLYRIFPRTLWKQRKLRFHTLLGRGTSLIL